MGYSLIYPILMLLVFEPITSEYWREIIRHNNYEVSENVAFNESSHGLIHCLSLCKGHFTCKSVYYNSDTSLCTGLQVDTDHPTGNKMSNGNSRFYRQVPSGCLDSSYEYVPGINLCFSFKTWPKLKYDDAILYCEQEHSQLISLNHSGKFDFVVELEKKFLEVSGNALVMGGYRSSVDSLWYWLSGEPIDMANFCPNEPSSATSKCVYLVRDGAPWCHGGIANRLDDAGCSGQVQFICEKYVY